MLMVLECGRTGCTMKSLMHVAIMRELERRRAERQVIDEYRQRADKLGLERK